MNGLKEKTVNVSKKNTNNVEVNYSIEEIENGYVLSTSKEWKDNKGNYQYETKKRYFKENPLDETALKLNTIKKALT